MLRLVAPVTDQLRVDVCPLVTQEGLAAKLVITGACPPGFEGDDPPPQLVAANAAQTTATTRAAACANRSMDPRLVRYGRTIVSATPAATYRCLTAPGRAPFQSFCTDPASRRRAHFA